MIIAKDTNIIIRYFQENDIPHIANFANNKKISDNLRDAFPNPYSLDDAKSFFNRVKNQNPITFFAIEYNGNYVGNIGLSIGEDVYKKSAEIGYFIAEPYWNKGIASKAIKLLVNYGFNTLNLLRIHACIFEYNTASMKVLEKCGFSQEGIAHKAIYKNHKVYNEVRYAIINN